jgi:hypothetical protein
LKPSNLAISNRRTPRKRGRENTFSDLSFLLLAVVAVVTKTFSDSGLYRLLKHDDELRAVCGFVRCPHRISILRRLKSLVPVTEEQISRFGGRILKTVEIGTQFSELSAIDGTMYQSIGRLWHKKHRQQGLIPAGLRNVDIEFFLCYSRARQSTRNY